MKDYSFKRIKPFIEGIDILLADATSNAYSDFIQQKRHLIQLSNISYELKPRTEANWIHDYICGQVKHRFNKNGIVRWEEINDLFGIRIDDHFFIRFKKIRIDRNEMPYTSNVRTKQQKMISKQISPPCFPEKMVFLTCGYKPNELKTEIESIYVFCSLGKEVKWIYDLTEKTSIEQGDLFTIKREDEDEMEIPNLVKIKEGIQKRDINTGTN